MSTIAKPPKPMRLNQRAQLVPAASFARWHEIASATAGLSALDLAILDILAEHYRRLQVKGFAGSVTIEKMAAHVGVETLSIRSSIKHLIELCLLGVKPGGGQRPHEYLPALPRCLAASLSTAAADDDLPPF
jgi:hypothetical protein